MSDDDRVLIAGAGPVGCSAALYLAQRGIPVTLVEAAETLPEDLRASTFHPPTLDMLDDLGVGMQLKIMDKKNSIVLKKLKKRPEMTMKCSLS